MKRMAFVALVLVLVLVTGGAAVYAAEGTIEITGGSLDVESTDVSMDGITLDGTDHSGVEGSTGTWLATDRTGTGAGWHVTVVSTDFTNEAGKTISAESFDISVATIISGTGGTSPTPVTSSQSLDTEVSILSADVDEGMGQYAFSPDFLLDVPATTYAGTYTATITVDVVSSPS